MKNKVAAAVFMLLFSGAAYGAIIDITTSPYNASTASADNAPAIQAAISAAGGGDTVLVPAGTFLSGPITLKSNMNLEIASGAILRMLPHGSFPDTSDFIYGKNLSNISITGSGTLDGQGADWWSAYNADNTISRPPAMIYLSGCTGVTLTGIAVQDSPEFHIQLLGSMSHVYATGLSITAAWPSPNTDGIDLRGNDINIENCYISDGDDLIQIGGSDPTSNVTVRNCTFGTGHGLSIGGYTQGGVSGLLVDNCTFTGTQYGIRWKTGRDRGGIIDNLTYSNITMTGILLYPFFLTSFYPNPSSLPPTSDDWVTPTATTPYWSNITLKNITASTAASGAKSPGIMWAAAEAPMTNILLDNVQVTGPSGVNFEFHHARGVTVTCTCRVDGKQPPLDVGAFDADIDYPPCESSTATPVYATATPVYATATPVYVTASCTATITRSQTPTFSRTQTITETRTAAAGITNTFTPTVTESFTATATQTFTGTPTQTGTRTFTNTATPAQTASFTATPDATATGTITGTLTLTPQLTSTATSDASITPSQSVNASPSVTSTLTPSLTLTETETATKLPSPSETFSATQTFTMTPVNTPVSKASETAVATTEPTATQTNTAIYSTPTATFMPENGGSGMSLAVIYPDPYTGAGAGLNLRADIAGDVSDIKVRIYTVSFRKIFEEEHEGLFSDKVVFSIPDGEIKSLASGVYYMSLTARSPQGGTIEAVTKPFLIIK